MRNIVQLPRIASRHTRSNCASILRKKFNRPTGQKGATMEPTCQAELELFFKTQGLDRDDARWDQKELVKKAWCKAWEISAEKTELMLLRKLNGL